MKIAISFLKIGSKFQGIFSVGLAIIDDVMKNKNNQISVIIDDNSFKGIINSRFPNIEIIYLDNSKTNMLQKVSILIYCMTGSDFLKKKFCNNFVEIESKNFDIIIHPNWSIYSFGLKTFSISSVHDTAFNNKTYEQGLIHKIKLKYLIKMICKYSDVILCESKTGKKDIINIFNVDPSRIMVRFNLPDTKFKKISGKQNQVLSSQFNKLKNGKFLLLPSRWGQYKNQPRVIKALDKYNKENINKFKLVLTGIGNEVDKIHLFIKQNALSNENIVIFPSVEIDELIKLYQNAYALIFPVLLGPTSIPFYEALENNCPIITSELEGHREVLNDAALFVDPLNQDSIYEALNKLNDKTISSLKAKMSIQKKYLINEQNKNDWLSNSLTIFNNQNIA